MTISDYVNLSRTVAGGDFEVCTGRCASETGAEVILEILTGLTEHSCSLLRQEIEACRKIRSENVVGFLDFGEYRAAGLEKTYIVIKKTPGEPLRNRLNGKRLPVGDCLRIALEVCAGLSAIHETGTAHQALHPGNISVRSRKPFAVISGFDFGRRFCPGAETSFSPLAWLDFVPYMSPEHTGRINSRVDHVSDLYCLGAILYQCMTGTPPFEEEDPLKLIHAHLAATPVPPVHLDTSIPEPLSDIIMKLLEKSPERRYQSCQGLMADLKRCRDEWSDKGAIAPFIPGQRDVPRTLKIPDRLYGRKNEIGILRQALDRVMAGPGEMVLVSGFSGIGKTTLVRESMTAAAQGPGYFVTGKFDQYRKDVPYSAFAQAIRELVQKVLAETGKKLTDVRDGLLSTLGVNARLIVDMVPEAETLTGPLPPLPSLGPLETANRFNRTFLNFFRFFCRPDHPLVLFLDDLQWADQGSLTLLKNIMEDHSPDNFLLIGAFRDNEVGPGHPLSEIVKRLTEKSRHVRNLTLSPLGAAEVAALVSDTVRLGPKAVASFSDLLEQKTGGNPFFLRALLKSLHQDNLLKFQAESGAWVWDFKTIRERTVAGDIVDFLSGRMKQCSAPTMKALRIAACLGNRFDLGTLALLLKKPVSTVTNWLQEAVESGILIFLGETGDASSSDRSFAAQYMFSHDRIQQAAYAFIPEAERAARHLDIGRRLLAGLPLEVKASRLQDIAGHMNKGADLIAKKQERTALAELNLQAGRKAREAAAFSTCFSFLASGVGMLVAGAWKKTYEVALALHLEAAEAAYLCGEYGTMERLAEATLANARDLLDKTKIYKVLILAEFARNNLGQAKATGLTALRLLGVDIPEDLKEADVGMELSRTRELIKSRGIDNLATLPKMTDPPTLAAMALLQMALPSALFTDPLVLAMIISSLVRLSLLHGNTEGSVMGYGFFAAILVSPFADIEGASRLARAALNIEEGLGPYSKCGIAAFTYGHYVRHWKEHPAPWTDVIKSNVPKMVERGNYEYAGHYMSSPMIYEFYIGRNLALLDEEYARNISMMISMNQIPTALNNRLIHQTVQNFLGRAENPALLCGRCIDAEALLQAPDAGIFVNALFLAFHFKAILSYHFGKPDEAMRWSTEAEKNTIGATYALYNYTVWNFYDSLSRLAVYPESGDEKRREIMTKVSANQKNMEFWASHAPMNFRHKFHLVEAEKCRVLGQDREAMEHYDQASCGAAENGYVNEEALACELAARFYLARGKKSLGRAHLTCAREAYGRWGAAAKVAHLEQTWPDFFSPAVPASRTTATGEPVRREDLASVVRAAHLISEEKDLGKLLCGLMEIVMVSAGAAEGFLVMKTPEGFEVQYHVSAEDRCEAFAPVPLEECQDLPGSVIYYVARTGESLLLNDAAGEGIFTADPHIQKRRTRSVLCLPVMDKGNLSGVLYLENSLIAGVFSRENADTLRAVADILSNAQARNMAERELLARQSSLRELTSRLALAEEEERRRIAAELHERIGHGLTETGIKLDTLKARYRPSWKNRPLVEEARALVTRTVEDTRSLIFEISPPVLYDLGLSEALEWLAEEMSSRHGLPTSFEDRGGDFFLPEDLRVFLFQSARELLFNARKHAGAARAAIGLFHDNGNLRLTVADNGRGFDPARPPGGPREKGGFGLFSLRERVSHLGGRLEIDSSPGKGARLTIFLPADRSEKRKA